MNWAISHVITKRNSCFLVALIISENCTRILLCRNFCKFLCMYICKFLCNYLYTCLYKLIYKYSCKMYSSLLNSHTCILIQFRWLSARLACLPTQAHRGWAGSSWLRS